ncbi:YbjN domain-containing protein [Aureivirga sp. CE67]|uniref:YbjN domain-containing protein n=1 Tax=Aureivirga sp. CE67 TaxID=1788983 RepID=UPI0018C94D5C|nr:YbjN domain-containing protein [Aureivirga sp. CE67]
MKDHFQIIKSYLLELDFDITYENQEEGILTIAKEEEGIANLIVGVAAPILILEQFIFEINNPSVDVYQELLRKNRDIIHGAFALDQTGRKVIFRDTLQLENLDLNELEGTLNSLSLLLSEYSKQILEFVKY